VSCLFLHDDEDPEAFFWARMALMAALIAATSVAVWLWFKAGRDIRNLSKRANSRRALS